MVPTTASAKSTPSISVFFPFGYVVNCWDCCHCERLSTNCHRRYTMNPLKNGKYRFDYSRTYIVDVQQTANTVTESRLTYPPREQYDRVLTEQDRQFADAIRYALEHNAPQKYTCICCPCCCFGSDQPAALQSFRTTTTREIRSEEIGFHVAAFEFDLEGPPRPMTPAPADHKMRRGPDSIGYDIYSDMVWSGSILSDEEIARTIRIRDAMRETLLYSHWGGTGCNGCLARSAAVYLFPCSMAYCCCFLCSDSNHRISALTADDKYAKFEKEYALCCPIIFYETFSRYVGNEWTGESLSSGARSTNSNAVGPSPTAKVAPEKQNEIRVV